MVGCVFGFVVFAEGGLVSILIVFCGDTVCRIVFELVDVFVEFEIDFGSPLQLLFVTNLLLSEFS